MLIFPGIVPENIACQNLESFFFFWIGPTRGVFFLLDSSHICTRRYTHAHTCTHTYTHAHTRTHTCAHTHADIRTHTRKHAHTHTHAHIHTRKHTHIHAFTRTRSTHAHVHSCTHTRTHIHARTRTPRHSYTRTHTHIHAHMKIHAHTPAHICTHARHGGKACHVSFHIAYSYNLLCLRSKTCVLRSILREYKGVSREKAFSEISPAAVTLGIFGSISGINSIDSVTLPPCSILGKIYSLTPITRDGIYERPLSPRREYEIL